MVNNGCSLGLPVCLDPNILASFAVGAAPLPTPKEVPSPQEAVTGAVQEFHFPIEALQSPSSS